jgi:hypothetical protein
LTPDQIGYSGYVIEGGELKFSASLGARTEIFVGPKVDAAAPQPLPKLVKNLPPSGFHLALPIVANFSAIEFALAKTLMFGETQQVQVPRYGTVEFKINSADMYQTTGKKLALGLDLEINPDKWFSRVVGKVWLTVGVDIDDQEHLVATNDYSITSSTNNAAFDLATAVLNSAVVKEKVVGAIRYDFSEEYEQLIAEVNSRLHIPLGDGLRFVGEISEVNVRQVEAEGEALRMVAEIDGDGRIDHDGSTLVADAEVSPK